MVCKEKNGWLVKKRNSGGNTFTQPESIRVVYLTSTNHSPQIIHNTYMQILTNEKEMYILLHRQRMGRMRRKKHDAFSFEQKILKE